MGFWHEGVVVSDGTCRGESGSFWFSGWTYICIATVHGDGYVGAKHDGLRNTRRDGYHEGMRDDHEYLHWVLDQHFASAQGERRNERSVFVFGLSFDTPNIGFQASIASIFGSNSFFPILH